MFLKLLPLIALAVAFIWMATASSRLQRSLKRDSKLLDDWTILERARAFAKALDVPGFEVRVLEMDAINGLALPDGTVFISRGLYQRHLAGDVSADAVAGVIAHEIGHVALGHHKQRIASWRVETAVLLGLFLLFARLMFSWVGLLAALGLNVMRNRMTQRDEFEADAFAAQLMMRANVNPNAMISLLKTLDRENQALREVPRWLLSHPPISERIDRLREVIDAGVPA